MEVVTTVSKTGKNRLKTVVFDKTDDHRFLKPVGFRDSNSKNSKKSRKNQKNQEKIPKNTRGNSKMFCEISFQKIDHLHSFKIRGSSKLNEKLKLQLGPLAAQLTFLQILA